MNPIFKMTSMKMQFIENLYTLSMTDPVKGSENSALIALFCNIQDLLVGAEGLR